MYKLDILKNEKKIGACQKSKQNSSSLNTYQRYCYDTCTLNCDFKD